MPRTPSVQPQAHTTRLRSCVAVTQHPNVLYRFAFFLFSIEALSLICLSRKLCFFFCMTLFELPVSKCPRIVRPVSTHWTAIMIGLFLFFWALVDELPVGFIFLPLREPNFSRPSRPF